MTPPPSGPTPAAPRDDQPGTYVSTGTLPPAEQMQTLVAEAYERFRTDDEGVVADYIPALADAAPSLFGISVVGVGGAVFSAGDTAVEFSMQSVSKPFVFALVCQAIGSYATRDHLGVDSTGLPFNSVMAVELNDDRTMNPMVNRGLCEHSGDWLYEVGLPGKSGVSGGIVTMSPGKGGLGTYSPRLDPAGNSVRGQRATKYLSERLGLNLFASEPYR